MKRDVDVRDCVILTVGCELCLSVRLLSFWVVILQIGRMFFRTLVPEITRPEANIMITPC